MLYEPGPCYIACGYELILLISSWPLISFLEPTKFNFFVSSEIQVFLLGSTIGKITDRIKSR